MFLNKKNKIVILVIFVTVFFLVGMKSYFNLNPLEAEAIEESKPLVLNWLSYNEGLLKAEKESKHILIYFYTDECGFCDKMDNEVYTDEEVKKILFDKFIAIKINAKSNKKVEENGEEITEKKLALLYQVAGYPTTWFLEINRERIAPLPGYVPAEQFVTVLKYISEEWYKKISFQEYVENNEG